MLNRNIIKITAKFLLVYFSLCCLVIFPANAAERVADSNLPMIQQQLAQVTPARSVAPTNMNQQKPKTFALLVKPEITSPQKLIGKTVAANGGLELFNEYLKQNNVNPATINILPTPEAETLFRTNPSISAAVLTAEEAKKAASNPANKGSRIMAQFSEAAAANGSGGSGAGKGGGNGGSSAATTGVGGSGGSGSGSAGSGAGAKQTPTSTGKPSTTNGISGSSTSGGSNWSTGSGTTNTGSNTGTETGSSTGSGTNTGTGTGTTNTTGTSNSGGAGGSGTGGSSGSGGGINWSTGTGNGTNGISGNGSPTGSSSGGSSTGVYPNPADTNFFTSGLSTTTILSGSSTTNTGNTGSSIGTGNVLTGQNPTTTTTNTSQGSTSDTPLTVAQIVNGLQQNATNSDLIDQLERQFRRVINLNNECLKIYEGAETLTQFQDIYQEKDQAQAGISAANQYLKDRLKDIVPDIDKNFPKILEALLDKDRSELTDGGCVSDQTANQSASDLLNTLMMDSKNFPGGVVENVLKKVTLLQVDPNLYPQTVYVDIKNLLPVNASEEQKAAYYLSRSQQEMAQAKADIYHPLYKDGIYEAIYFDTQPTQAIADSVLYDMYGVAFDNLGVVGQKMFMRQIMTQENMPTGYITGPNEVAYDSTKLSKLEYKPDAGLVQEMAKNGWQEIYSFSPKADGAVTEAAMSLNEAIAKNKELKPYQSFLQGVLQKQKVIMVKLPLNATAKPAPGLAIKEGLNGNVTYPSLYQQGYFALTLDQVADIFAGMKAVLHYQKDARQLINASKNGEKLEEELNKDIQDAEKVYGPMVDRNAMDGWKNAAKSVANSFCAGGSFNFPIVQMIIELIMKAIEKLLNVAQQIVNVFKKIFGIKQEVNISIQLPKWSNPFSRTGMSGMNMSFLGSADFKSNFNVKFDMKMPTLPQFKADFQAAKAKFNINFAMPNIDVKFPSVQGINFANIQLPQLNIQGKLVGQNCMDQLTNANNGSGLGAIYGGPTSMGEKGFNLGGGAAFSPQSLLQGFGTANFKPMPGNQSWGSFSIPKIAPMRPFPGTGDGKGEQIEKDLCNDPAKNFTGTDAQLNEAHATLAQLHQENAGMSINAGNIDSFFKISDNIGGGMSLGDGFIKMFTGKTIKEMLQALINAVFGWLGEAVKAILQVIVDVIGMILKAIMAPLEELIKNLMQGAADNMHDMRMPIAQHIMDNFPRERVEAPAMNTLSLELIKLKELMDKVKPIMGPDYAPRFGYIEEVYNAIKKEPCRKRHNVYPLNASVNTGS